MFVLVTVVYPTNDGSKVALTEPSSTSTAFGSKRTRPQVCNCAVTSDVEAGAVKRRCAKTQSAVASQEPDRLRAAPLSLSLFLFNPPSTPDRPPGQQLSSDSERQHDCNRLVPVTRIGRESRGSPPSLSPYGILDAKPIYAYQREQRRGPASTTPRAVRQLSRAA